MTPADFQPENDEDDRTLLSTFVRDGSARAFTALVERHLGMVFAVACRRTGSAELAQEAAQNVFCRLALHAPRLEVRESLAPWLHTVAVREAGTLLRTESAHARVLQRFSEAQAVSANMNAGPPPPPPPALDHLDEALASLPERERRVLIVRFLQGCSLRETAAALSVSEEAARKRLSRALEKLSAALRRRGVAVPATALGIWLAAPPAQALPAGLAASISTAALNASATAGIAAAGTGLLKSSALQLLMHTKTGLTLTFLAAALLPLAWNHETLTAAVSPRVSGTLRQALSSADRASGAASGTAGSAASNEQRYEEFIAMLERNPAAFSPGMSEQTGVLWKKGLMGHITRIHLSRGDPLRMLQAKRILFNLPEPYARRALEVLTKHGEQHFLLDAACARMAEFDPQKALEAAAVPEGSLTAEPLLAVLQVMAATDLPGALAAVNSNAPEYLQFGLSEKLKTQAAGEKPIDMQTLDELLSGNSSMEHYSFASTASRGGFKPEDAETMLRRANELPQDSPVRRDLVQTAAMLRADTDPEGAAELAASVVTDSDFSRDSFSLADVLAGWKQKNAAAAAVWLHERSGLTPEVMLRVARDLGLPAPSAARIPLPETESP